MERNIKHPNPCKICLGRENLNHLIEKIVPGVTTHKIKIKAFLDWLEPLYMPPLTIERGRNRESNYTANNSNHNPKNLNKQNQKKEVEIDLERKFKSRAPHRVLKSDVL